MERRVMVTGGAGFIGSHLAEAYLSAGYEVTVLDDLSSGRRENVPAGAEFVESDVRSEKARQLLEAGGFYALNHHAAQMDVRVSVQEPIFDAEVNIAGLLNLLEGCRGGGVKRVIFASSGGVVYGESDELPYSEDASKLPVSPYGVSKLAAEYYLCAYAQLHGLEPVSLRYANVYGPRQSPHGEAGVVAIFGNRIRSGKSLTVYGDGTQTRDYVYVSDVARVNLAATNWPVPKVQSVDSVAFNVGTGVETSVNKLVEKMIEVTGANVPVEYAPPRQGELSRSAVRIERAWREWGWRPETSLLDGLRLTYRWIREAAA